MLHCKQKPKETKGGDNTKMLIKITTVVVRSTGPPLRSAGPLRFVVDKKELVAAVIQRALKYYEREGRLPVLGSDLKDLVLYCSTAAGVDALSPWETIGSRGGVNFTLCKTQPTSTQPLPSIAPAASHDHKKNLIKGWITKSLNLNIYILIDQLGWLASRPQEKKLENRLQSSGHRGMSNKHGLQALQQCDGVVSATD